MRVLMPTLWTSPATFRGALYKIRALYGRNNFIYDIHDLTASNISKTDA